MAFQSVSLQLPYQENLLRKSLSENVKNSVRLLNTYSNSDGYIRLTTEVESNFEVDDVVYITYIETGSIPDNIVNLENPASQVEKFYNGYKILSVKKSKNEIVINKLYNDIPTTSSGTGGPPTEILNQYLSKVSMRGGVVNGGHFDGVVFFECDVHENTIFNQGTFSYSNITGITFFNKYKLIPTITSTTDYKTKFKVKSATSTAAHAVSNGPTPTQNKSKKYYYNNVMNSSIKNSNVLNGRFINSQLSGEWGTHFISDGYFSGCTISGYTINGGEFYDCIILEQNTWNDGYWENENGTGDFYTTWLGGVWNGGIFENTYWSGGTFNGGLFSGGTWENGIVNGGTFMWATWNNGLVRNGDFIDTVWLNGVFNGGTFHNSEWKDGIFNNGSMTYSAGSRLGTAGEFLDGTFRNGSMSAITFSDGEIYGGDLTLSIFNGGKMFNCKMLKYSTIDGLSIYGGETKSSVISGGTINNGVFQDCDFDNTPGVPITINNGKFNKCNLIGYDLTTSTVNVYNGEFNRCDAYYTNFYNGVFTWGNMYESEWYNGTWNDSIFHSTNWYDGHFYGGIFSGGTTTPSGGWTAQWHGGTFHYGWFKGVFQYNDPDFPNIPYWRLFQTGTASTR